MAKKLAKQLPDDVVEGHRIGEGHKHPPPKQSQSNCQVQMPNTVYYSKGVVSLNAGGSASLMGTFFIGRNKEACQDTKYNSRTLTDSYRKPASVCKRTQIGTEIHLSAEWQREAQNQSLKWLNSREVNLLNLGPNQSDSLQQDSCDIKLAKAHILHHHTITGYSTRAKCICGNTVNERYSNQNALFFINKNFYVFKNILMLIVGVVKLVYIKGKQHRL